MDHDRLSCFRGNCQVPVVVAMEEFLREKDRVLNRRQTDLPGVEPGAGGSWNFGSARSAGFV